MSHATIRLSEVSHAILDGLTVSERTIAERFICPNDEPIDDAGVQLFYSLLREGTIEFADADTPNVHLHAPAFRKYCPSCKES